MSRQRWLTRRRLGIAANAKTATPASRQRRIPTGAKRERPLAAKPRTSPHNHASLAGFFFGRAFGRRASLETVVRDRLAALDREAVRTGGKTGLGTLDGGELFA